MKHDGQRIQALDFIRAASMIGIFAYHACFALEKTLPENGFFFRIPDETGFIFVGVFFILSGFVLQLRYADQRLKDIPQFYRKRAVTLLPMYYLVFLLFLSVRLVLHPAAVIADFKDHGWTLIFTVLGLDGYLAGVLPTWYLAGEWFIGALILLYLLYPLLNAVFRRIGPVLLLITLTLYLRFLNYPLWSIATITNIFSCMLVFACGMVIVRYRIHEKWSAALISVLLLFILVLPPVRDLLGEDIHAHIASPAVFLILFQIGNIVMRNRILRSIFAFLSSISYPFYLIHHVALDKAAEYIGTRISPAVWICGVFAASLFCAWLIIIVFRLFSGKKNAN